jgi:hypothetical protein
VGQSCLRRSLFLLLGLKSKQMTQPIRLPPKHLCQLSSYYAAAALPCPTALSLVPPPCSTQRRWPSSPCVAGWPALPFRRLLLGPTAERYSSFYSVILYKLSSHRPNRNQSAGRSRGLTTDDLKSLARVCLPSASLTFTCVLLAFLFPWPADSSTW